jgi:hypothetical protein
VRCAAAAESSRSSDRFAAKSVHHLVLLHHSVQAARHERSNRSNIPASAWLFELLRIHHAPAQTSECRMMRRFRSGLALARLLELAAAPAASRQLK